MKRIILTFSAILAFLTTVTAQATDNLLQFNHLDLSVTTGTTGIGFDLSMPVVNNVQVRFGASFFPTFYMKMPFPVEIGEPNPDLSDKENKQINDERFRKLSGLLEDFMGLSVNSSVDMIGQPTFNNLKLLVDFKPLNDKRWHFTAGFFLGSKRVAKAYNTTQDMATLVGVVSYNSLYNKVLSAEPLIEYNGISIYNPQLYEKIRGYGRMTMNVGKFAHDIYAQEDIYYDHTEVDPDFLDPVIDANGRPIEEGGLQYKKGELMYQKGDTYRMVPDENCMVRANAYANAFRPYIGFGYGGYIDKEQNTQLSFDCGLMFWGGVPNFVTHEGISLNEDLTNVRASIQRYLDIADKFPVFPVLSLRVTHRLF